jgi:Domain of unknown function (DUF1876)
VEEERAKVWTIEVEIVETPEHTDAKVDLVADDRHFGGWGRARRNPADPDVPAIGDELACARALHDLGAKLLDEAARRIEEFEGRHVEVRG